MHLQDLKSNLFIPSNIKQSNGILSNLENFITNIESGHSTKTPIVLIHLNLIESSDLYSVLLKYQLNFNALHLYDFGQITSLEPKILDQIFDLILRHNGHIILLDANPQPSFCLKNRAICHIAPTIDTEIEYLNKGYTDRSKSSLLGYQTYLTDIDSTSSMDIELVRLGLLRSNLESIEPIIRRADSLLFNSASIKYSDCPKNYSPNPSGLFLEEACRISRYAGLTEQVNFFHLYGFAPLKEHTAEDAITAQALAQIVWYFLNGVNSRINDYPKSTSNLNEFIISIKDHDLSISFWKSTLSGRWWLEVPNTSGQQNPLFPCSYEDYLSACEGQLSKTVLKALETS